MQKSQTLIYHRTSEKRKNLTFKPESQKSFENSSIMKRQKSLSNYKKENFGSRILRSLFGSKIAQVQNEEEQKTLDNMESFEISPKEKIFSFHSINGITLISLQDLENLAPEDQEERLRSFNISSFQDLSPEKTRTYSFEEDNFSIKEMPPLKKYSIQDRKLFLKRIYGFTPMFETVVFRTFPINNNDEVESDILRTHDQECNEDQVDFSLQSIPMESVNQFLNKCNVVPTQTYFNNFYKDEQEGWYKPKQLLKLSGKIRQISPERKKIKYNSKNILNGTLIDLRIKYLKDQEILDVFAYKNETKINHIEQLTLQLNKRKNQSKWMSQRYLCQQNCE